jgi:hypothetical protein
MISQKVIREMCRAQWGIVLPIREGANQFSDMGGTPMPRGTGVPPVGLQKTEMRLIREGANQILESS